MYNESFIGCTADYADASAVIFGAPFDGTTSFRPGTRFAPKAIRADSYGIETYSPYLGKDLTDHSICDIGDLDFPFGNPQRVIDMIEEQTQAILNDGKLPVMLGGEHLVTLGALRAVRKKYRDLHIIHLDAHTDLRTDYLGEELSHACVIRRAWELVGDGRIHQFGIRSGERYEFEFAAEHCILTKYDLSGFAKTCEKLRGVPVYFTLDLDILDPSIFPGTGTPEAGGVSFTQLMDAVRELSGLNIVGLDVNELSPTYDASGVSTAVACKILREILLAVVR